MKPIKLKRIYPKLNPPSVKKKIGKAILWGLVPIEPLMELLILPASLLIDKLRKEDSGDWIEIMEGKIIVDEKERSKQDEFEIKAMKDLKIFYFNNFGMEGDDDVDERQWKNNISRIVFNLDDESHEYFYDSKKKEILKLCELLYDNGIIFKEYNNGQRVFMGRQPKYKEVQELKKKYNMDW